MDTMSLLYSFIGGAVSSAVAWWLYKTVFQLSGKPATLAQWLVILSIYAFSWYIVFPLPFGLAILFILEVTNQPGKGDIFTGWLSQEPWFWGFLVLSYWTVRTWYWGLVIKAGRAGERDGGVVLWAYTHVVSIRNCFCILCVFILCSLLSVCWSIFFLHVYEGNEQWLLTIVWILIPWFLVFFGGGFVLLHWWGTGAPHFVVKIPKKEARVIKKEGFIYGYYDFTHCIVKLEDGTTVFTYPFSSYLLTSIKEGLRELGRRI